ncbi:bifunctional 4-hydroxy-2-oxoglutarate aldolase/2-dehydro-3-deoxy-phosphogluconate aldolase [Pseudogracilibacillus sp. SO30301A]|uniref:bifunctional 4-hydroxy-2-oxoglutarate aldolase/2-dehydro-3-deoxy-phosphogluconate aldolase n=1 Tax=Pseudogracilibacillus sp. SO30301A TaxID=3098291 RepID=UPI00300E278C
MGVIQALNESGVVAIIRGLQPNYIYSVVEALKKGGVRAIEVTVDTPNVCEVVEKLRSLHTNDLSIGAGTVLNSRMAEEVIEAGAQFILSPNVNKKVIETTKQHDIISIPGAFTPSEIVEAHQYGADVIKLFPAHILGTKFIKSIRDPLPNIPLLPTGGINSVNATEFINLGVLGVGVGGSLVFKQRTYGTDDLLRIQENASSIVTNIKEARKEHKNE